MINSVLKNIKILLSTFVLTSIINILTGIYLARELGPQVYGIYLANLVFREVVSIPLALDYSLIIYKYRKIYFKIIPSLIYIFIILTPFYLLYIIFTFKFFNNIIPNLELTFIIILGITFIISMFSQVTISYIQSNNQYSISSRINISSVIISSVIAIFLSLKFNSVYILIFKDLVYQVSLFLLGFYFIKNKGVFMPSKITFTKVIKILWPSLKVFPINVLNIVLNKIDRFLINIYYPPLVLSNIYQAKYYTELFNTLLTPLRPMFFEKLLDKSISKKEKNIFIKKALIFIIVIGFLYGLIVFLFGQQFIIFVLGEKWELASEYISNLAIYGALLPVISFLNIVSYYKNQNSLIIRSQIFQLVFIVISFFILNYFYYYSYLPFIYVFGVIGFILSFIYGKYNER